ncbi:MAG: ROK family protein [Massiliimalia sp.]|jgi:transcriptional regulator of PTS gene
MIKQSGSNIQDVKMKNRMLVLKLISTHHSISRVKLAKATGLSKMTVGNIVAELLEKGFIEETQKATSSTSNYGRKPVMLTIAKTSPCICGMLIRRGVAQVILADFDGTVFEQINFSYSSLADGDALVQLLADGFFTLKQRTTRKIAAIGISSLGPINTTSGMILNPPHFYNIENLPIVSQIHQRTQLPVYLVNDVNAGALAEKLYGAGQEITNFTYLHIMNGIGAGFILENKLYNGDSGQSGEIGHTSINFAGPKCVCGNTGCLELYANLENMQKRIRELAEELTPHYKKSPLVYLENPTWCDIVDAGNAGDFLAIAVLDEFCSYISYALTNTLNLLDLSHLVVGYDSRTKGNIIEQILQRKITKSVLSGKYHDITVIHAQFGGNAPLIGSIAMIADKIFSLQLPLSEIFDTN